jgi:hypothetical protein
MQDFFEFFGKILSAGSVTEVTADFYTTEGTEEHRDSKALFFPAPSVNHAGNPVPQVGDMEINQQPDSDAAQPHVRQELCLMNRMDGLDAFHFHDDEGLDDQVDAIAKLDLLTVVHHRQANLACCSQTALPQLMGETRLVGAFQKPRSKQ